MKILRQPIDDGGRACIPHGLRSDLDFVRPFWETDLTHGAGNAEKLFVNVADGSVIENDPIRDVHEPQHDQGGNGISIIGHLPFPFFAPGAHVNATNGAGQGSS
jgi:hypothetical protein